MKWIEVEAGQPDENRRLLVTNNIDARDAFGQPSHVWIINLLQEDDEAGWYCGYSGDDLIRSITHWRYLDEAVLAAPRTTCLRCGADWNNGQTKKGPASPCGSCNPEKWTLCAGQGCAAAPHMDGCTPSV